MTRYEEDEQPMTYSWMLVFVVFLFILVIATVVVVAVSVSQYGESLPQSIDVVILERGLGISQAQVHAINANMNFRRNIYILGTAPTGTSSLGTNVFNVNFIPNAGTAEEMLNSYFLEVNNIRGLTVPDRADHVIFLADQTVPFRFIEKSFLFYGNRPRMFNIFRDTAETTFLSNYFTYTCPALVENVTLFDQLPNPPTVQNFVLFEISQERVTLRNDFNRDIFVNADSTGLLENSTKQFSELASNPPLFATFHLTGSNPILANLVGFLDLQFP